MADRVLFISWGTPVRGAEERGLEVFNESLGMFGRMQQEGRIEGFDVMLFEPNGSVNGCIQLHGGADQIAAVREAEEFRRSMMNAALVVDELSVMSGYANDGVAREMALYQEAIAAIPQRA
jgi:hypothetical protein